MMTKTTDAVLKMHICTCACIAVCVCATVSCMCLYLCAMRWSNNVSCFYSVSWIREYLISVCLPRMSFGLEVIISVTQNLMYSFMSWMSRPPPRTILSYFYIFDVFWQGPPYQPFPNFWCFTTASDNGDNWGLSSQKQVLHSCISNWMPQKTTGCCYLSQS